MSILLTILVRAFKDVSTHMLIVVQLLSHVRLFVTPWTVACQAPLFMEFSRQEYWSGCHSFLQGIFLTQGSNPGFLQCRRPGFDPWNRKIPWKRKQQPTPVFLSGEFHGERSLVDYSPPGSSVHGILQTRILEWVAIPFSRESS